MPDHVSTSTVVPNGTTELHKPNVGEGLPGNSGDSGDKHKYIYEKILEDIQNQQDELLDLLSLSSRLKKIWRKIWKRRHPELLKAYGVIYTHLAEAQRLLVLHKQGSAPALDEASERQLSNVFRKNMEEVRSYNIHAAWEYAALLERLLLLLGDEKYIFARLVGEAKQDAGMKSGTWDDYLAKDKLTNLITAYQAQNKVPAETQTEAVEFLAFLYNKRSQYLRNQRAREELKADYLNRLTIILALLLLLMLQGVYLTANNEAAAKIIGNYRMWIWSLLTLNFTINLREPQVLNAVIAAITGALGSTLSGFYKLRDETGGIATLRAFRSAMWAQPFVGAVIGVLLLMFIGSELLSFAKLSINDGTKWMQFAIFSFIAGYSEPFFLGLVQRVAGAADKKEPARATGDKKDSTEKK